MIEHLDINGVNVEIWSNIKKYIRKKIGRLDRLLPRHAKKSVHARVILSETKAKKKLAVCEVILKLPHSTLSAKQATLNMFASVDIVEAKLASQIRKYKTIHGRDSSRRLLRRLLRRMRRNR